MDSHLRLRGIHIRHSISLDFLGNTEDFYNKIVEPVSEILQFHGHNPPFLFSIADCGCLYFRYRPRDMPSMADFPSRLTFPLSKRVH
jgi:hypothetical protein